MSILLRGCLGRGLLLAFGLIEDKDSLCPLDGQRRGKLLVGLRLEALENLSVALTQQSYRLPGCYTPVSYLLPDQKVTAVSPIGAGIAS